MRILSIDIGTTNIKALLSIEDKLIPIMSESSDKYEGTKDATYILLQVVDIIKQSIEQYNISDLVINTPMHTLLFLDENFNPVRDIYIWSDNEFKPDISCLGETFLQTYQRTGTPIHSMSPMVKLMTLKNIENYYISDLKGYLMKKLVDEYSTDVSNASATGMYNIHKKQWDCSILSRLKISQDKMPLIREVNHAIPLKMNPLVSVSLGSTDGAMAMRGVSARNGELVISIGTSVGVRYLSNVPIFNESGQTFCYDAGFGEWLIGNASNNGGNLYRWLSEEYYDGKLDFESFIEIILKPISSLICTPHIYGERGPFWDEGREFKFMNINDEHTKEDIVQSVIFSMFTNISLLLESLNTSYDDVVITGGFVKDKRVAQVLSNYLNIPLIVIEDEQAVCVGGIRIINNMLKVESKKTHIIPNVDNQYDTYKRVMRGFITNSRKEYIVS